MNESLKYSHSKSISMTAIDNDTAAVRLASATTELEDLRKYWSNLAWWERNMSLEAAFDCIFEVQNIDEYKSRCELIIDKAEELDVENMATYPSDEELENDTDMDLYYQGNPRLPQGMCVDLMQRFSSPEIAELADYMGVDAEEPLDVLLELNNRSMATYYALRNRIGEMVKGQIQYAQA